MDDRDWRTIALQTMEYAVALSETDGEYYWATTNGGTQWYDIGALRRAARCMFPDHAEYLFVSQDLPPGHPARADDDPVGGPRP